MIRSTLCFFAACVLLAGCSGNSGASSSDETTTSGNIRIVSDEAYKLTVDAELMVFHSQYKYAKVNPVYGSEGEMMDLLMKDSARLIVAGRKFSANEREVLEAAKVFPKETLIAYDALTFIVHKSNPDSQLTYKQLLDLFQGRIAKWNQLDPAGQPDSIRIVFDHARSGNARFLKEALQLSKLPVTCFAVNTNEEVLKYVESNPKAMGVVGSNWISDPDDSLTQDFTSRIRVLGISSKEDPDGKNGFHQPYQEYIADGTYPFKREVYILSREIGTRLGTGFAAFVASDKGQRIILKSGLLPAVVPVRFVEVTQEF
jgi:phosphate transport system substrate-binding protein